MRLSLMERAYELADSSTCTSIADIEKVLIREKYQSVVQHLTARSLRKALNSRMRASSGQV